MKVQGPKFEVHEQIPVFLKHSSEDACQRPSKEILSYYVKAGAGQSILD